MKELLVDLETYSDIDLKKCGVYRYVESPNFRILLFGYAFDNDPVKVVDLAQGETLPIAVINAIFDYSIKKKAFNAAFERACLKRYFGYEPICADQWHDIMIHSLILGLPGNLYDITHKALAKTQTVKKDGSGKALITLFCKPCKPTRANGGRTRNLPHHFPEKWEQFKEYCMIDVESERALDRKLAKYPIPENEQKLWELDQKINETGFKVDTLLMEQAIKCNQQLRDQLTAEAIELTGLPNPNSRNQLIKWLNKEEKENEDLDEIDSLTKKSVPALLEKVNNETSKRVLEIRQLISKSSVSKYQAMANRKCNDDRVKGLFQFYGAKTGRWASRGVQVQNLPKSSLSATSLNLAREMLKRGDFGGLELLYGSVPDVLSQLIRTAFIPEEGYRFIVTDFSAIEARVLSWFANERWRLEVFQTHGKIYEASAAAMFGVPFESIDKKNPLRQKGKIAELALGYQGSLGAMKKMGALEMGLAEEELLPLVIAWRKANPMIAKFWADCQKAALDCIKYHHTIQLQKGLIFSYEKGIMFIQLPSGRKLSYWLPRIEPGDHGEQIVYLGVEAGKWSALKTYGGKLTENIVQATSRDCLAVAMQRVEERKFQLVAHVHDEIILEVKIGESSLDEINKIISQPIFWAEGLPLNADGFEGLYYRKD